MKESDKLKINELLTIILNENDNEEAIAQLSEIIDGDSEAIKYYYEAIALENAICDILVEGRDCRELCKSLINESDNSGLATSQDETISSWCDAKSATVKKTFPIYKVLSLAAMFLVCLFVAKFYVWKNNEPVAKIKRSVDARWSESTNGVKGDVLIKSKLLNLVSGLVEIVFEDGKSVVVKGPAEFKIDSTFEFLLYKGNVVATVDEHTDEQFVIETPTVSVVDYGTEFGVSVCEDGTMAASVFQGEIDIRTKNSDSKDHLRLGVGEGGKVYPDGTINREIVGDHNFVRSRELNSGLDPVKSITKRSSYGVDLKLYEKTFSSKEKVQIANIQADKSGQSDVICVDHTDKITVGQEDLDYNVIVDGELATPMQGAFLSSIAQAQNENQICVPSVCMKEGNCVKIKAYDSLSGASTSFENMALAYFPFNGGWTCGNLINHGNGTHDAELISSDDIVYGENLVWLGEIDHMWGLCKTNLSGNGIWELSIPGVNSLEDGVLLICGADNKNSYASSGIKRDGSGWVITTHLGDVNSYRTECGSFSFVYIPYETPNITAGVVTGKGGVLNGTSGFDIARISKGIYRLSIDGHSPQTGTLIVSNDMVRYATDNITSYEPDGNSWIIKSYDIEDDGANLQDVDDVSFTFAFIPFDSTPSKPGFPKRSYNNTEYAAARFNIDYGQTDCGFEIHRLFSKNHMTCSDYNYGDYNFCVNGNIYDYNSGVLFADVCRDLELQKDDRLVKVNASRTGSVHAFEANAELVNVEANTNLSLVWFPFSGGYAGGHVNFGGDVVCYNGSAPLVYYGIDGQTDKSCLLLDNTRTSDGILFVTAQNNSDCSVSVAIHDEYSWDLLTSNKNIQSDVADETMMGYVYLPYESDKYVLGHIDRAGKVVKSNETIQIQKESDGQYRLSGDCLSARDGVLILNSYELDENAIVCYAEDDSDFVVMVFDSVTGQAKDVGFVFAYLPCK